MDSIDELNSDRLNVLIDLIEATDRQQPTNDLDGIQLQVHRLTWPAMSKENSVDQKAN